MILFIASCDREYLHYYKRDEKDSQMVSFALIAKCPSIMGDSGGKNKGGGKDSVMDVRSQRSLFTEVPSP